MIEFKVCKYLHLRHELLGMAVGVATKCDPYVGGAISNSRTTELEGKTLLLPDDCNRSAVDGCLLPGEGEVVIL